MSGWCLAAKAADAKLKSLERTQRISNAKLRNSAFGISQAAQIIERFMSQAPYPIMTVVAVASG